MSKYIRDNRGGRRYESSQGTTYENNAVPWDTVREWMIVNPQKHKKLPIYKPTLLPYEDIMEPVRELIVEKVEVPVAPTYDFEDAFTAISEEEIAVVEDLTAWKTISVQPICPFGIVFYGTNPKVNDDYYINLSEADRRTHHRDYCTTAQTVGYERIKSRKFPKNKTIEAIVKACFEEGLTHWDDLCWESIAALAEVQLILTNDTKKKMQFFPADIRTWSNDKPVFVCSDDARYFYKAPALQSSDDSAFSYYTWVTTKEKDGYSIVWPEHDDKVEVLKEMCTKNGWNPPAKIKKAELVLYVGKEESLAVLKGLS